MTMPRNVPCLVVLSLIIPGIAVVAEPAEAAVEPSLFVKDNLVAWCIVPFDAAGRGPEQRAAMLEALGLKKFAYDWREPHVPTFEDEIVALRRHGIELTAYWCSGGLSETNRRMFALFEKYGLRPQIWVTAPNAAGKTQEERVEAAGRALLPLAEEARRLGSKLALYNHGGWQGEPETLVAITQWLRRETGQDHLGIVYNFHHGHEHLDRFPGAFHAMVPYLFCVNLNGMAAGGAKILPLGSGADDLKILKMIRDSGYRGPIGILGHRPELDAKKSLEENLDGLKKLLEKLGDTGALKTFE